jgi:hypothetical protein
MYVMCAFLWILLLYHAFVSHARACTALPCSPAPLTLGSRVWEGLDQSDGCKAVGSSRSNSDFGFGPKFVVMFISSPFLLFQHCALLVTPSSIQISSQTNPKIFLHILDHFLDIFVIFSYVKKCVVFSCQLFVIFVKNLWSVICFLCLKIL